MAISFMAEINGGDPNHHLLSGMILQVGKGYPQFLAQLDAQIGWMSIVPRSKLLILGMGDLPRLIGIQVSSSQVIQNDLFIPDLEVTNL